MAKDETAGLNQAGSNITKLKDDIVKGVGSINELKLERTSINEQIGALRSDLEAKGIKKQALDMAMTYMNWDEDKREGFDIAYTIVREALGAPLATDQMDMHDIMADAPKTMSETSEAETQPEE